MIIDNQIRDEKPQYDINREPVKISANKIGKYEYLKGEEILRYNQKQIIDQAKFAYYPLGKAFEKQIKTIEDQGKKQVIALEDLKLKEQTKAIEGKSDDKLSIQKEKYDRLLSERVDEIQKRSGEINYNKLIYHLTTPGIAPINFIKFKGPFNTFKEIRDGDKTLQEIEKDQKQPKSSLGEIKSGNPKHKTEYQLDTIKNVQSLYDSRQKVIDLFNDNAKIRSEAIHKTKQDEKEKRAAGLKILTPKQMLQRLPIALAQVKAGNNSENLLNEIRQIVYSLYQSKEITKKVYNNIIKSMQL